MGDITESQSIIGAVEAAGEVVVDTLLHRIRLFLVWLSQHRTIYLHPNKTLETVCLFSLLKEKKKNI